MTRYRAEGWNVYQGDTVIATCHTGDQGQLASALAERIAALLEADFKGFCEGVCAEVGRRAVDMGRGSREQSFRAIDLAGREGRS